MKSRLSSVACFVRKYAKLSTQNIAGFTLSQEELTNSKKKKLENILREPPVQDESTNVFEITTPTQNDNRLKALQYYRQTIRLLKKQGQPHEYFEESLRHIRSEYKKSGLLGNQDSIDVAFKQADDYVKRLQANLATLEMQSVEGNNSTEYLEKYWSDYYQTPGALEEWYCEFDDLRNYLPFMKNVHMMVIGAGLSSLPAYLVNKYASKLIAVDVSSFVVKNMKELFKEIPTVEYVQMDVLSDEFALTYKNEFDFIIEKALFDTILINDKTSEDIVRLSENVYNALKPGGMFMMITVLDLHAVKEMFEYQDWVIEYVGNKKMAGVMQDGETEIHFIRLRK